MKKITQAWLDAARDDLRAIDRMKKITQAWLDAARDDLRAIDRMNHL